MNKILFIPLRFASNPKVKNIPICASFVILSKGETAGEGMSKIYISEFVEREPGIYSLVGIKDEKTWQSVKLAMKQIVES